MGEINPRSMESHLLKICERVIRLKEDDSDTNTKHLNEICKFLFDEMKENDKVFNKLFQTIVPAGSYPDSLKISEPDEYDLLIVFKFPKPSVARSRPGYVTIDVSNVCRKNGQIIDDADYERFVDEEGYLLQNKVLDWIRGVVRSTLLEYDNVIVTDENRYVVCQSSNGPAVTLKVTVEWRDITFSIDFVGCLAFHSNEWWVSDVQKREGVWNAIPKPIKINDNVTIQQRIDSEDDVMGEAQLDASYKIDKITASGAGDGNKMQKKAGGSRNENRKSGKVKRPPPFLRYKHRKPAVSGNKETAIVDPPNRNSRPEFWYRKMEKPSVVVSSNKLNVDARVQVAQKSRWEKSVHENTSDLAATKRRWLRRRSKKIKSEDKVEETTVVWNANSNKPSPPVKVMDNPKVIEQIRKRKSKVMDNAEATSDQKRKSVNRKGNRTKNAPETKPKVREVTIISNPQKNREWICSYAAIERELIKGTQTMKPLIRIFKKIRDNNQLTNLKSYFIKTIFLHHNEKNGTDYWKQSLAVLFMQMFDVILKHLYDHRLDSFWHKGFNLFRSFRKGQTMAIYDKLLKMKNDLIENLEGDNPEFIYELVCTEEERSRLLEYV